MNDSPFSAGVARIDITPPVGVDLTGGAFGPSRGVLHPLWAKAVVLRRPEASVLLVVCDLLGIDEQRSDDLRRAIAGATGLAFERIMLACTHTHGAPATVPLRNWGRVDPDYMSTLCDRLVRVAEDAVRAAAPARLAHGQIACPGVAINRCLGERGVVDDVLGVMRLDDATGRAMAVVISFACHPVNLHSAGVFTPDFPHFAERAIQAGLGLNIPVLFLSGAGGDLNPSNFTNQTPSEPNARQTGELIAAKALERLGEMRSVVPDRLSAAAMPIDLPLRPLPDAQTLRATAEEAGQRLETITDRSPTNWTYAGVKTRMEWALEALELVEQGGVPDRRTLILQGFALDDLAVVGIGGELFAEYGQAVRRSGVFEHIMIATQANASVGYLFSPEALAMERYEAVACPRYLGVDSFTGDCGSLVRDGAIALLRQLAG
ncbi:MAG: hypothetical protein JJU36_00195 [Phycisphaeraceae bacterium]|nr:hypothetical protein [Phycisphaeraceae bacterium]